MFVGVYDSTTPLLASDVSKATAALCSLKEAQEILASRDCVLDIKSIRNIVKRFAARARHNQEQGHLQGEHLDLSGCRVVVEIDGGRVRIRRNKKGRKAKKKRHYYHTDWREPKLFIVHIVNEKGRMEKSFPPIIDASMQGPEHVFALLSFYLGKMNIARASTIAFVSDGALWIWERAKKMFASLGVKLKEIHFVLDFFHAIEHLSELLEILAWSKADKKLYLTTYRRKLKNGDINGFFTFIQSIAGTTKSDTLKRAINYFVKNKARMAYRKIASLKLPIGSGAVESAIRRVINLRLKGPGIFWLEDTANEMLMLRCYYKAKRWSSLKNMASYPAIMEMS
jgi:hypothetical protein